MLFWGMIAFCLSKALMRCRMELLVYASDQQIPCACGKVSILVCLGGQPLDTCCCQAFASFCPNLCQRGLNDGIFFTGSFVHTIMLWSNCELSCYLGKALSVQWAPKFVGALCVSCKLKRADLCGDILANIMTNLSLCLCRTCSNSW